MNGSPLLLSSIRLCHSVSVFFQATGGIAESSFKWHWLETSVSSAEGFQQGSPVVIEMQIPAAPWWHAEAKWVKPNRHKCVEKWLKSDFRCMSVKVKPLKVPRMKVESALPAHTAELQGFCFLGFSLFYSQSLITQHSDFKATCSFDITILLDMRSEGKCGQVVVWCSLLIFMFSLFICTWLILIKDWDIKGELRSI